MKRFVIVGLGNFGASAAEMLTEPGHDVAALDSREEAVGRIASHVARAAVGNGAEQAVLERLGAGSPEAAIVSIGDEITASVLTSLALRDCGVRDIYVKGSPGLPRPKRPEPRLGAHVQPRKGPRPEERTPEPGLPTPSRAADRRATAAKARPRPSSPRLLSASRAVCRHSARLVVYNTMPKRAAEARRVARTG